jgi:hypothetical protein
MFLLIFRELNFNLTIHNPFRAVEGLLIDIKTRCRTASNVDSFREGERSLTLTLIGRSFLNPRLCSQIRSNDWGPLKSEKLTNFSHYTVRISLKKNSSLGIFKKPNLMFSLSYVFKNHLKFFIQYF